MTIERYLDALRSKIPGCSVVAFGDYATRLILRSSNHKGVRRERLDELCRQAANCFGMLDATTDICRALEARSTVPNEVVVLARESATVFVRSDDQASEFLGVICPFTRDTAGLSEAVRETLKSIAQAK